MGTIQKVERWLLHELTEPPGMTPGYFEQVERFRLLFDLHSKELYFTRILVPNHFSIWIFVAILLTLIQ